MTDTALAKPSRAVRAITAAVRDHANGMQRLQDAYFAKLKRAEADYFEGVKRITDAITRAGEPEPDGEAAPGEPVEAAL